MAPHDPAQRAPALVRASSPRRRIASVRRSAGRASAAAHLDRGGVAEQLVEIWYQPKIDLRRKCLAGAEALARIHHPQPWIDVAGQLPAGIDGDSIARLTEHAMIATLRSWSMFDEAGINLHYGDQRAGRRPSPGCRIAELVRTHRPPSERWPVSSSK